MLYVVDKKKMILTPAHTLFTALHTPPKYSKMQAQEHDLASELSHQEEEEVEVDDDREFEAGSTSSKTRVGSCRKKQQQLKLAITKTKQKKLLRDEKDRQQKSMVVEAFHSFYRAQYRERWATLLSALDAKPRSACLRNKFADPEAFAQTIAQVYNLRRLPFISLPLYESSDRFPHPQRDERNVYACYLLDAASVLATEALEVAPQDRVLDLCAAPGGKSVAILQRLGLPMGSLTANEMSADRRRRLWKVVMDYIPEDLRHRVLVTGRDGTQWSQPELFDKVLVDAPCSSERHLLQNHEELYKWTAQRTVQCAKRQLSLLNAGLKSVHVGGLVVYSTCSISNTENDEVIEKAMNKRKVDFEILHRTWLVGERTKYGWIVLPDTEGGWGPLYFSVLRRVS